ncbi:MAG: cytochrome c biogenesis protein ResB [Chloroflexota bacterium]
MDRFPARDRPARPAPYVARSADRALRLAGDVRLAAVLLVVGAAWNVAAAIAPVGVASLDSPAYAVLLGALLLSGLAGMAVRWPAAWREWRHPGAVAEGRGTSSVTIVAEGADQLAVAGRLRGLGYRVATAKGRGGWAVHGVRRGWTRFAGLLSHVALVLTVVGAGIGTAFATETTFSLLPGEQALLDAPRPGFTDAIRFDGLDAEFGPDGRPTRLDTAVTFLRDGTSAGATVLQVNAPGSFGGYLVHGWSYGPAARLRITSLADRVLHDAPIPLDTTRNGSPAAILDLPAGGVTLAMALVDPAANTLAVSASGSGVPADLVLLAPGDSARIGDLRVRLDGFTSWVTFLSRRDPGMGVLFAGAAMLTGCLAVVLWLPRRRVSVRSVDGGLRLAMRGERFDTPAAELERVRGAVSRA